VNLGIGIQHLLEADHLLGGGGDVRINAGADPGEDGRAERWSATLSSVALVALAWYRITAGSRNPARYSCLSFDHANQKLSRCGA
jgi:hypothetical protein